VTAPKLNGSMAIVAFGIVVALMSAVLAIQAKTISATSAMAVSAKITAELVSQREADHYLAIREAQTRIETNTNDTVKLLREHMDKR